MASHPTVLITGASGYIATAVARYSRSQGAHLRLVTRRPSLCHSEPGDEVLHGDICQRAAWTDLLAGVDLVFHLAGQTSATFAQEHPEEDYRVNVLPMLQLIEACKSSGTRPAIVFAGTETQAGVPNSLPVDETHPDRPTTIYDAHKQQAETALKSAVLRDWVQGVSLRIPTVYGPGPRESSPDRGILNLMIRRALRGEALTIYDAGEWLREFVYVDDLAEALWRAGMATQRVNGRHLMVSGTCCTIAAAIRTVAQRVSQMFALQVPVHHIDSPVSLLAIERRSFRADSSALQSTTGWRPRVGLAEGIDRTARTLQSELGAPES